jgi:carbon-monoxide dehydrogenase large subunit
MNAAFDASRFGSGRAVARVEDAELLAGRGRFAGDVSLPGQTYIVFLRSLQASARIVSVDTGAAGSMPGVLAVYTGAALAESGVKPIPNAQGFARPDGSPSTAPPHRALAHEVVRFVGEPVAAVVAESREQARDAAEAILVEYEDLPAVVETMRALAADAPRLWEKAPGNIAAEMAHGDPAATRAAFESAAHRVTLDILNQRLAPCPMEPRSVIAHLEPTQLRLNVHISSQMPTGVMQSLGDALPGLGPESVRVTVGDVGGGFGNKTGIYSEDIVVAWAALQLRRPVKWEAERAEEFASAYAGRDVVSRAELALDAGGKALALRVRSFANVGAYATNAGVAIQLLVGPWVSTSIYDIATIDLRFSAVLTHTAAPSAYRGAGRPEAIYIIERLFDAAAREMKIDPAELRRRNMIRPEQMPYRNPMAQVYDSGHFEQILDRGLALADWNGFEARREASRRNGRLRGRGLATFLEWTGGMALEEKVGVNVRADGIIELHSATQAMGQGIATSYAQLAVDVFGVPIDRIRVLQGDTDRARGFGSAGSRSLFTGGSAVHVASQRTVDHARDLASEALEAAASDIEYRAGRLAVAGTDVGIDLFELAARQPEARIFVEASSSAGGPSFPNACHVCEVEIDPQTGAVEVLAYASVSDIGRVVSPAIARGQVEGGAVQGIGQALCEAIAYDPDSGQLLTGSFMDYAIPRASMLRGVMQTEFDTSIPCLTNPLGVKGVGELGTIGATPAVVNAVVDALDHAGLGRDAERIQMPLTAERVWRALAHEFDPSPFAGR